ncbi:hypothetical protein RFI_02771, partial [Reticulomyxa filosa]
LVKFTTGNVKTTSKDKAKTGSFAQFKYKKKYDIVYAESSRAERIQKNKNHSIFFFFPPTPTYLVAHHAISTPDERKKLPEFLKSAEQSVILQCQEEDKRTVLFHAINSKAPECVLYVCAEIQNRAKGMEADEKESLSVSKSEKKKVEDCLNFGMQALESKNVAFTPLMKVLQYLRKKDEPKEPFYQMALILMSAGVNVNVMSLVESNNDSKKFLQPSLPLSVAFQLKKKRATLHTHTHYTFFLTHSKFF